MSKKDTVWEFVALKNDIWAARDAAHRMEDREKWLQRAVIYDDVCDLIDIRISQLRQEADNE